MRVDLLLKSLCFVKTRSQARRGCESGRVKVNGRAVKPSREIRAGDVLEIRYPARVLVVEMTDVPGGQVPRKDRDGFIRVISDNPIKIDRGVWDE